MTRLKRLLHAAILARMEGQNRDTAAWRQALRYRAEQGVERGELVIDRDTERLQGAAD